MAYHVDGIEAGENPHVNYEPSSLGGLKEGVPAGQSHTPHYEADLVRQKISCKNVFQQAGDRYRAFEAWERDELVCNLVDALKNCPRDIQERIVSHFTQADAEYGRQVAEGIRFTRTDSSINGGNLAQTTVMA